jgi:hypothetical protein
MLSSSRFQVLVFSSLLACVIVYSSVLYLRVRHAEQDRSSRQIVIPPEGIAKNDTGGKVPGNPANGVRSLQILFSLYQKYKQIHGVQPPGFPEFIGDLSAQPNRYGFRNFAEAKRTMENPDNIYADDPVTRSNPKAVSFNSDPIRPDGSFVFGPKEAGTRDVLAYTDTYVHLNSRKYRGSQGTVNPVGFYLVLWEDGEVTTVPYDQMRYVTGASKGAWKYAFPGQAGVPKDALTYDEWWTKEAGWEVAPRGVVGGQGITYTGKPVAR